jgi:hypothetical protein
MSEKYLEANNTETAKDMMMRAKKSFEEMKTIAGKFIAGIGVEKIEPSEIPKIIMELINFRVNEMYSKASIPNNQTISGISEQTMDRTFEGLIKAVKPYREILSDHIEEVSQKMVKKDDSRNTDIQLILPPVLEIPKSEKLKNFFTWNQSGLPLNPESIRENFKLISGTELNDVQISEFINSVDLNVN